ncbi:hypothetical protein KDH83_15065 [Achromobacter sp. Marseille-Q0513]|uniref:hypothetical protein n=1 Tax=Achromobacter sp. Marseille-Q0513 TaxID=2829161 RepID=UPI001BA2A5F0|nr:hypothetical protein [Achromobacter sp. Marseille-Q0513]MBR8654622.1 hypothetical protein [Achromobacter sp. Marseille-Q0513]
MHMLLTICNGLLVLAVFLLFGRLWGGDSAALVLAAKLFIPAWLLLSIVNLWIGVSRAGYTVREELPILLLVFGVPAVVAALTVAFTPRG